MKKKLPRKKSMEKFKARQRAYTSGLGDIVLGIPRDLSILERKAVKAREKTWWERSKNYIPTILLWAGFGIFILTALI